MYTIYLDFKGGGRAVYEKVVWFQVNEHGWEIIFVGGLSPVIVSREVSVASVFSDGKLA